MKKLRTLKSIPRSGYAPGTEFDPRAPWNEEDAPTQCQWCGAAETDVDDGYCSQECAKKAERYFREHSEPNPWSMSAGTTDQALVEQDYEQVRAEILKKKHSPRSWRGRAQQRELEALQEERDRELWKLGVRNPVKNPSAKKLYERWRLSRPSEVQFSEFSKVAKHYFPDSRMGHDGSHGIIIVWKYWRNKKLVGKLFSIKGEIAVPSRSGQRVCDPYIDFLLKAIRLLEAANGQLK